MMITQHPRFDAVFRYGGWNPFWESYLDIADDGLLMTYDYDLVNFDESRPEYEQRKNIEVALFETKQEIHRVLDAAFEKVAADFEVDEATGKYRVRFLYRED